MFSLTVNGKAFAIDTTDPACWVTPSTTLNEFLRHHTPFHATKVSCAEGGCGACTVALTYTNPTTGAAVTRGINSCLAPLLSLNGLSVTTNDGATDAVHQQLQTKLAEDYGTQCGYCSSGMVMAMYAMLQENPNPTTLQIEQMLDGNLCRCTGYRPILSAFKSFGTGEHGCNKEKCCKKLAGKPIEIEEAARTLLASAPAPQRPPASLGAPQMHVVKRRSAKSESATAPWIEVDTEAKLQYWLKYYQGLKTMLVVGATSQALDKVDYDAYVAVGRIPSFTEISQSSGGVFVGAAVTFTDLINYLEGLVSQNVAGTGHFPQLCAHLHRVASTLIRNRGCVVGNLVFTHAHQSATNAFPSDAAIALMGIGATVTLFDVVAGTSSTVSLTDFFTTSLATKYVQSITIPWAAPNEVFKSYKIAIRQTLDHAIVNGAMRAVVDPATHKVVGAPTIAIGGVFTVPTRLTAVESLMVGADVTSASALQQLSAAFQTALSGINPAAGRVAYRQAVAVNYFYKFMLALQPQLSAALQVAADVWLTRDVSSGTQAYPPAVPGNLPVSAAIAKVDGINQTNGTAQYTGDIPAPLGTQFGAVVASDRANVTYTVNLSVVTGVAGYVQFVDASAIPGQNQANGVPIFANGSVTFAGQIIGVVVAESESVARECATLIEAGIQYSAPTAPVITTIAQAKAAGPPQQTIPGPKRTAPAPAGTVTTVSGTVDIGSQFHFHLEPHSALAQVVESQVQIDIASQSTVLVQSSVCSALQLPMSDVVVRTRRCGGGYGGKILAPMATGAIVAAAAWATKRPFRLDLTLKESMRYFGARPEYEIDYTAQLTTAGKFVSLNVTVNATGGAVASAGGEVATTLSNIDNAYYIPNFSATANLYQTNVPAVCPVRGPGWIQSIVSMEMIMNNIAAQLNMSPADLRSQNFYVDGQTTPGGALIAGAQIGDMFGQMLPKFQSLQQASNAFNAANQFVKRGVAITSSRFGVSWAGGAFNVYVAVHPDASVSIHHGGIEIGQGINTKVAQGAAYALGMSTNDVLTKIKVQPNNCSISSNPGSVTGGSVTSEMCTMGAVRASRIIRERLDAFWTEGMTFAQAVAAAYANNVDLTACAVAQAQRSQPGQQTRYNSWGVALSCVEVDTLTGQFEIKETDLLFDCGVSLNPAVDIGQIEGGFMFGVGWFTSEEVKWDPTTAFASVAGSWHYKPPGAYDVPEQLNVTLLANSNNTTGVLGSKATGEPPLALAVSVVQALENAINASRTSTGLAPLVVSSLPLTVDKVQAACAVTPNNFTLQ